MWTLRSAFKLEERMSDVGLVREKKPRASVVSDQDLTDRHCFLVLCKAVLF